MMIIEKILDREWRIICTLCSKSIALLFPRRSERKFRWKKWNKKKKEYSIAVTTECLHLQRRHKYTYYVLRSSNICVQDNTL